MAEQLLIDHVGHRGDGIALAGARAIAVPYALAGETVVVDADAQRPDRARLAQVIAPSPERIAPFCPYFGACGGCAIQHWELPAYRRWKRQLAVDALAQAGIDCEVQDLVDAHGGGRRRITLHASRQNGVLNVGFTEAGAHRIVPIAECPILVPSLQPAIPAARAIAEALTPSKKPLDIQATLTANGLDIDVRGSGPLDRAMTSALMKLAANHRLARLTRHGEMIVMHAAPQLPVGATQVTLPPGSFLQATQAGEEALAERVLAMCGRAKRVADLFCGIGPFALRLAQQAQVIAYDSEAQAIEALRKAAQGAKGLKPVKAEARDLFRRPLLPHELNECDAVVFDPPRQGALAQVQQIAASKVPLVIAVSCNASTFARDARVLIAAGFRIGAVTPVDQFRHSAHLELVAPFTRR